MLFRRVPTAEVDPGKAAELLAAAITIAAEQVLKQSQAPGGEWDTGKS